VLERECAAYQEQRRQRYQVLTFEIGRAEHRREDATDLKRERDELLLGTKRTEIRGWEIVLVPAGAARPAPRDFAVALRFDPSEPKDPAPLKGAMEAWIAPRGWLARLFTKGWGPGEG
jgi:hypothetical protein